MNVLDLFSGIGGMSIGLEAAGMRTVAFCEKDEWCRERVLARHWPHVPRYDDVRTLPYIGGVDVVAGGFPCQPFSFAGKRMGQEDDRHLWPAMLEVIRRERPAWVLGENVIGLVNMGLDQVLSDLGDAGYATRAFDIPAVAQDAPHLRRRIWIVGRNTHDEGQPAHPLDAEVGKLQAAHGDAADAHGAGLQGRHQRAERAGERIAGAGLRECHWPRPDAWIHRVDDGLSPRMDRLRALGNAVVPQVVEVLGRAIMRAADEATAAPLK